MRNLLNILKGKTSSDQPSEIIKNVGDNTLLSKSYATKDAEKVLFESAISFPSPIEVGGLGIGNASCINRFFLPEAIGIIHHEESIDKVLKLVGSTEIFFALNNNTDKLGLLIVHFFPTSKDFQGASSNFFPLDKIIFPKGKSLVSYLDDTAKKIYFGEKLSSQISDVELKILITPSNPHIRIHDIPSAKGWERILFCPNTSENLPGLIAQVGQIGESNYLFMLDRKNILAKNHFRGKHAPSNVTEYIDYHVHFSWEKDRVSLANQQMTEEMGNIEWVKYLSSADVRGWENTLTINRQAGVNCRKLAMAIVALNPKRTDILAVSYTNMEALFAAEFDELRLQYFDLAYEAQMSDSFKDTLNFLKFSQRLEKEGFITTKPPNYIDMKSDDI